MIVLTHLHPQRGQMRVSGGFEALERDAHELGLTCQRLRYRDMDIAGQLETLELDVAFLNSGVMAPALYDAVHAALAVKRIRLFNTPEDNRTLMRFERFYPLIADLTATSAIVRSVDDVGAALERVGLPAFAKGSIISAKAHGWDACVLADERAVRERAAALRLDQVLVLRQLLPLRRTGVSGDFPTSREYRFYLLDSQELGHGYFWPGSDPYGVLAGPELADARAVVQAASVRIGCPLIAVDVGQLQDGTWKVIEIGDPQHTGVMHMPRRSFFAGLDAYARERL